MKYKVGDKVRIKSIEWYNANKDKVGDVLVNNLWFVEPMSEYLGEKATIVAAGVGYKGIAYKLNIDNEEWNWFDDFFEGKETDIIKDIAEVLKSYHFGISIKEEVGKLIIEPLMSKEKDLPIDTPCFVTNAMVEDVTLFRIRRYAGHNRTYAEGEKSSSKVSFLEDWNYIIPCDRFNPNDIEESLKYNIVK